MLQKYRHNNIQLNKEIYLLDLDKNNLIHMDLDLLTQVDSNILLHKIYNLIENFVQINYYMFQPSILYIEAVWENLG